MSINLAFWIWTGFNVFVLGCALFILVRSEWSGLNSSAIWMTIPLAILYAPVAIHFEYAQTLIVVLALLVCVMRAMECSMDRTAGILLAIAGLLRAFPLLLLVYLAITRRWRVLRWALVGLTIGGALTVALAGRAAFDFFEGIGWVTRPVMLRSPANLAIGAVVWRSFSYILGSPTGGLIDPIRRLTIGCIELGLLAVAIKVTWPLNGHDPEWGGFSLWIVLAIMLSPVVWPFYLVLLLIPYSQIMIGAYSGRASMRAILMALGSYGIIGVTRTAGGSLQILEPYHALLDQGALVSLLMAYVATYWFVTDNSAAISEGRGSATPSVANAAA